MKTIFAAPTTRRHPPPHDDTPEKDRSWAFDLQTAINRAEPGDHVVLLPGRYHTPATIMRSGTANHLIKLYPETPGTVVLDGGRAPTDAHAGGMEPLDSDFAMLKVFWADHWQITGLTFANCWPTCIYARSARHITVSGCEATGGRYFMYLRQKRSAPTHHITVQDCAWVQDPTFDMWRGALTWHDVKASTNPDANTSNDASYYNGAFLGGFDVAGRIIVRRNDIRHAFNGIRLDMRGDDILEGPDVDDGPVVPRNRDVAIYDNTFSFIRDNAVEPEVGAQNWRVFGNLIYGAHAAFSQDQVRSRDMFYIGNRILNDHRAGPVKADGADAQQPQGGRIFKWFKPERDGDGNHTKFPVTRRGFWSLFNLVQTRTSYVKKGWTRDWDDRFTVLGIYPKQHPHSGGPDRNPFDKVEWEDITVEGMVTDDAVFGPKYTPPKGRVETRFVEAAFEPPKGTNPTDPKLDARLGGWDGNLVPTADAQSEPSTELKLATADGPLVIPGGQRLGPVDVDDLGLGHWRDDWPDGPPGQPLLGV